jgi:hypothetical protein
VLTGMQGGVEEEPERRHPRGEPMIMRAEIEVLEELTMELLETVKARYWTAISSQPPPSTSRPSFPPSLPPSLRAPFPPLPLCNPPSSSALLVSRREPAYDASLSPAPVQTASPQGSAHSLSLGLTLLSPPLHSLALSNSIPTAARHYPHLALCSHSSPTPSQNKKILLHHPPGTCPTLEPRPDPPPHPLFYQQFRTFWQTHSFRQRHQRSRQANRRAGDEHQSRLQGVKCTILLLLILTPSRRVLAERKNKGGTREGAGAPEAYGLGEGDCRRGEAAFTPHTSL